MHLDLASAYSSQSLANIQKIQDQVCDQFTCFFTVYLLPRQTQVKFPELEQYAQCWPVTDLIRMRLKYTSGRERRLKAFRVSENIALAVSASKASSEPKAPAKLSNKVK